MVARSLIVLLCLCFSWCFGQPAVVNRRAFVISGLAKPPSGPPDILAGFTNRIALHWVFTDVSSNSIVTNWYDRIQSNLLTQANSIYRPTNSALGMHFDSQFLTGDPTWAIGSGSSNLFMIVLRPETISAFQGIVGGDTGGAWAVNSGQMYESGFWSGVLPTSRPTDFLWGNNGGTINSWTNGVVAQVGGASTAANFGKVGYSDSLIRSFNGWLLELALWTNINTSSVLVSNIHWYCTNTYPTITP